MTSVVYNKSLNKCAIVAKDRRFARGCPSSTTTHSAPQERRWPCWECGQKPSSLACTTLQSSWLVRKWGTFELHTEATALMVGAKSRAGPENSCRCKISAKIWPPQEKPTITMRVWTFRSRIPLIVSRVACTLQSTEYRTRRAIMDLNPQRMPIRKIALHKILRRNPPLATSRTNQDDRHR